MYANGISLYLTTRSILAKANAGTPPVNTVAPAVTGSVTVGSTLTSTTGTWTGTPVITYAYQWKRGASNIVGATNSTYILQAEDVEQLIKCTVTATNAFGSASADSNAITATWEADAQAFITAAAITDPTQQSAINTLVTDLKGYGIWTKMKALYPFVGGTASSHKWNLKDPRDLDAAYRLVFSGGWTHSANGALPNGTNAFADTKLQPSSVLNLNSTHLSVYSRTSTSQSGVELGSSNVGDVNFLWLATRRNGNYNFWINQSSVTTPASSNGSGFFIGNRTASNVKNGWRSGIKVENVTTLSDALPIKTTYIGAAQYANVTSFYSNREQAFASIGDGLTDTEAANFYTTVNNFQVALSRNV